MKAKTMLSIWAAAAAVAVVGCEQPAHPPPMTGTATMRHQNAAAPARITINEQAAAPAGATYDPQTGQTFTRLLLPRVTVLGVGSTAPVTTTTTNDRGDPTTEELPRTLLTVAVDQKEAQKMLYASSNGELAFALLNGQSKVRPGGAGVTSANLFR